MSHLPIDSSTFLTALRLEKAALQKQLTDDPSSEQKRLRWINFRSVIETRWVPIVEMYLTVLGKLWFGSEERLGGTPIRNKLFLFPLYTVKTTFYGPMAIFEVGEKTRRMREARGQAPNEETKTEEFTLGFRLKIVLLENDEYVLQNDEAHVLNKVGEIDSINESTIQQIIYEAYLQGPQAIYSRWKS